MDGLARAGNESSKGGKWTAIVMLRRWWLGDNYSEVEGRKERKEGVVKRRESW